ncbi:MAG: peptidoglycan DD-metalloendopeptidase family protein [Bacteroidetes bacterium]|nr:peptidoglycan DD-metalloendopeptidase family protein [Bacteroidota bacterium]
MKRKCYKPSLLILLLLCLRLSGFAQDRKAELESNKQRLEEEISFTSKLIGETRESKNSTLGELQILNARIGKQESLIATIQKQMLQLEEQSRRSETELRRLETNLKQMKEEYARMIYFAYKNRNSYNKLVFLFAAEDFNQAYERLKYFQQYAVFRQNQITKIEETQAKIKDKLSQLEQEKNQKQLLFEDERKAQINLNTERSKKDKVVSQLSQKENQLKQSLRQKEKEAQQLQRAIEQIIAEEIRLASERKGEKVNKEDRLLELTPEELELSNSFALNRGKLPWPTERGIISARFGEQPHPVLKKVTINNNGIDIATARGSDARVVFDGVVVSTNRITNTNYAVIVRHGDYFSVYSNLEEVYVKRGDKVKTKELVGRIHTDKNESKTEVHFELWKGRMILDPDLWLAR